MYIVKVLIEHPIQALDTTFDYLYNTKILKGIRVKILFNHRYLIGYVLESNYTNKTKEELEQEVGFKYQYINEVIDEEPLLNEELDILANKLSKITMSPLISLYQAMLPKQLKPSTNKSVGIKYIRKIKVLKDGNPKTKKQKECLEYLINNKEISINDIPYSKALLDKLVEQEFIEYINVENYRNPYDYSLKENNVILTKDQQYIVDSIINKKERISLIHGVTGSGKTEIYLALSSYYIKQGKNVIMLVPEISLTPMMVKVFKERFGQRVAILHSRLSQGEKYDEYRKIKRGEVNIVVGARSAIFAPIGNIGIIILDEEHDASYKQESNPRYYTTTVAKMRAKTHHAQLVLGSATPSIESYARALKGVYDLYELKHRINQKPLPKIEIIDMIEEAKNNNYSLFSKRMTHSIQNTIDKGEQVILLLNKRGYASILQCKDCGEIIKCPHCSVSLTYHKQENKLICHYCGYSKYYPCNCNNCSSKNFKLVGYGTEKVEKEITSRFNKAKVIRYDVDTTKNKNGHLKLLEKFKNQEANILLGTQMISKGLDFENVTFVGVLNADISLNIPDFRASERTFQLLTQVSGRSGRGNKQGTVMIQTYNPDHYVIECVKNYDYNSFFKQEMNYRQLTKYPPFCHMCSVLIQGKNENIVNQVSLEISNYLKNISGPMVLGPAKSVIYKMNDLYRQRILIKFKDGHIIYENLNNIINYYTKNKRKVTIVCDFNPYSQM